MIASPRRLGRYVLHRELASGGMAAVYLARLVGPAGFARAVAIKRLHGHLARDPEFVAMFLDEARIAARIRHPNVVPTVDVVAERGELFIVMEYVHGASLAQVLRALREHGDGRVPPAIAAAIAVGMLAGLHAAHEATSEDMQPLGVVHRDVSPPNVLLGADGVPRTVDFGIAKALGRAHVTREGQVKGKLPYMAPEQLRGDDVDRRVDVWAASVVLWEMLAGQKLFTGDEGAIVFKLLEQVIEPPTRDGPEPNAALDQVVLRGLARDRDQRFPTALAMLEAIERVCPVASGQKLSVWLEQLLAGELNQRRLDLAALETTDGDAPPLTTRGADVAAGPAKSSRTLWLGAALASVSVGAAVALFVVPSAQREAPHSTADAEPSSMPEPTASAPRAQPPETAQVAKSLAESASAAPSQTATKPSTASSQPEPARTNRTWTADCKNDPGKCRSPTPARPEPPAVPKGGGI